MIARLVLPLGLSLLSCWGMALVALAAVAGNLTIAGQQLTAERYIPIKEK